jgi:hypothetical protein
MQFTVHTDDFLQRIIAEFLKFKLPLNITIESVKSYKTQKQLRFFFGGLASTLCAYFYQTQGVKWSADDIKEMMYRIVNIYEEKQYPNGEVYKIHTPLSRMTKEQASLFIDASITWIDTETTCVLPVDLRYCWLTHLSKEFINNVVKLDFPEKCPEYLAYQSKLVCVNCGVYGVQVHHIRANAGGAQKSPDWYSIPLCHECHIGGIHGKGKPLILPYKYEPEKFCKLTFHRWYRKQVA